MTEIQAVGHIRVPDNLRRGHRDRVWNYIKVQVESQVIIQVMEQLVRGQIRQQVISQAWQHVIWQIMELE